MKYTLFTSLIKWFTTIRLLVGRKPKTEGKSLPSYSLYKDCFELPFAKYIDLVVDNKLEALIKEGDCSADVLQEKAIFIMQEFASLCGSNSYKQLNMISDNINEKSLLYTVLQTCSICFPNGIGYSDIYKDFLKGRYINITDNAENNKRLITNSLKRAEIDLRKLTNSMQEILNKNSSDNAITREFFLDQLIILGKNNGYRINAEDITLAEYARLIVNAKKEIEQIEASNGRK